MPDQFDGDRGRPRVSHREGQEPQEPQEGPRAVNGPPRSPTTNLPGVHLLLLRTLQPSCAPTHAARAGIDEVLEFSIPPDFAAWEGAASNTRWPRRPLFPRPIRARRGGPRSDPRSRARSPSRENRPPRGAFGTA